MSLAHTLRVRWRVLPRSVRILWILALLAIPVWATVSDTGWDLRVYGSALTNLHHGRDPYLAATDIQKQNHALLKATGNPGDTTGDPPYSYVYAPLTLPLLKVAAAVPRPWLLALYLVLYAAGTLLAIAVCTSFAEPTEAYGTLFLAGLSIFFPGLLANGVILGGNIAYLLYGAILVAAVPGWKRNRWTLFYLAVFCAACVKAPMLSLILVAPLSGRGQWPRTVLVGVAAVLVFLSQPVFMPQLFKHYLEAVELQFSLNHDFGCSPTGLFSDLLYQHGMRYSPACYVAYAAFTLPSGLALLYGARLFQQHRITLQQWLPVLLVGVLLLNPRILEYDAAAITLPMALILWRMARAASLSRIQTGIAIVVWLAANGIAVYSWQARKTLDGVILVSTYVGGMYLIHRAARHSTTKHAASAAMPFAPA